MTRRKATLARIVLAAAAAASVATSQIPKEWQLLADAPTVTAVIDDANPRFTLGLHAELRDWGAGLVDGGLLIAHVTLHARTTGTSLATGRLVLEPSAQPTGYALAPGETRTFDIDQPVFASCTTSPCFADATLRIERDFQQDDPPIDITIVPSVDASGPGRDPNPGTLRLTTAVAVP